MGNVASESVSDTEALQNVMKWMLRTQAEFREAEGLHWPNAIE